MAICGSLRRVAVTIALAFGVLSANPAHATLMFDGVATGTGAGIGTSNVVLTVQNTPTEQGCVGWNGTVDIIGSPACPGGLSPTITGGDEKTGSSQTQTRTVAQAGVLSGASLVLIVNVSELAGTLFTTENLSLSIYSPTGAVLFNSGNLFGAGVPPAGGVTLNSSLQGQANLGFAFVLHATEAAAIDPFLCTSALVLGCGGLSAQTLATNANNRIGLAALLTNVQGGNETFSVADLANVSLAPPPNVTPEPSPLVTFAVGLVFLGLSRKILRRRSTP